MIHGTWTMVLDSLFRAEYFIACISQAECLPAGAAQLPITLERASIGGSDQINRYIHLLAGSYGGITDLNFGGRFHPVAFGKYDGISGSPRAGAGVL